MRPCANRRAVAREERRIPDDASESPDTSVKSLRRRQSPHRGGASQRGVKTRAKSGAVGAPPRVRGKENREGHELVAES